LQTKLAEEVDLNQGNACWRYLGLGWAWACFGPWLFDQEKEYMNTSRKGSWTARAMVREVFKKRIGDYMVGRTIGEVQTRSSESCSGKYISWQN